MKMLFLTSLLCAGTAFAQALPDPLVFNDGTKVGNASQWQQRRAEMRKIIEDNATGHMPPAPAEVLGQEIAQAEISGGKITAKKVRLTFGKLGMDLLLLIPAADGKKPVIVLPCFEALPEEKDFEAFAGKFHQALDRGYAMAMFHYTDLRTDDAKNPDAKIAAAYPGNDWGALATWAWGMSRCVDWLVKQDFADTTHFIAAGHSRLGKAALIAGAFDERFAVTAAAGSGCGGTALYRFCGKGRGGKEGLEDAVGHFPHWFGPGLANYLWKAEALPFDQHWLIAMVAPRKLIAVDGLQDPYTNKIAVDISIEAARPAFEMLAVPNNISLHFREGKHLFAEEDWTAVLDFAAP